MEYIDKEFIGALGQIKNVVAQTVLREVERFRFYLTRELPLAGKQNFHIIGVINNETMAGSSNHFPPEMLIDSQQTLITILGKINPDLIGIQGFAGQQFSYDAAAAEWEKAWRQTLTPEQKQERIAQFNSKPTEKIFHGYLQNNPQILYYGVEHLELAQLIDISRQVHDRLSPFEFDKEEHIHTLINGAVKLRCLLMIAKLNKAMRNHGKTRAVLPVGIEYLQIFINLSAELQSVWRFYNTVKPSR